MKQWAAGEFCREITDGCNNLRAKTVSGVTAFARR